MANGTFYCKIRQDARPFSILKLNPFQMYRKIVKLRGEETLVIEWQESWQQLVVKMDNVVLGNVETKEELKAGRNFRLPNGKSFMVLLSDYGLEVWYEGVEVVSGTKSGTTDFFGSAFLALMSVGTINMVLGVMNLIAETSFLRLILCVSLFVLGLAMLILGFFTKKHSEKSNLILGLVFGGLSLVVSVLSINYICMAATVYLISALIKGLKANEYQPTVKVSIDEEDPIDQVF